MSLYDTIARECGEATAEAVRLHLGGMRVKVPSNWTAEHLLNVAGEDHARRLIEKFPREILEFPQNRVKGLSRNARIVDLRANGMTLNQIARAVGCSENWVRRVLRGERDSAQGTLL